MQQHHQITLPPPHHTDHEITSLHSDHNHNINNNKNNTFDHHHHHLRSTSSNSSSSPQPPPLPHLQSQASRVVQIPLDQVYCRVLHSADNNNNIPSSADHQNSDHNHNNTSRRHRSNCFSSIWSRFFLIFIVFILLLIIFAGILYLSLNPKSPTFIIDSLSLKHSSSSPKNNYSDDDGFNNIIIVTYNLSMEASNPNSHLGFYYLQGGSASLSCNKQEMAHGTPPEFYTGKNGIRVFDLVLDSSSEALSKLFAETIMKEIDKYSNGKISLVLFIRLPVKMKVGELKLWKMKMEVTCDLSISLSSLQSNNNNKCRFRASLL